jgi:ribonuclease-3
MRTVKPGKLAILPGAKRPKSESALKPREIWDDFGSGKKRKKKEYERGEQNRMVPRPGPKREPLFGEAQAVDEGSGFYRDDLEVLEERIGYQFKERSWLTRAVTHRSALALKERTDYERLEFLGDAVLDLTIAHMLSDRYPEAKEGELSKMRAALVNTQALADVAKALEMSPFIRVGRSEAATGGQERPSIMADVMEAVIGAIYRDSDYNTVFGVIERIFGELLERVEPSDPKTELQEALHAAGSEPPSYLLELVEGPEHAPTFVTVVIVDGEIAGRGKGNTKKAAQQSSAAEALKRLFPIHLPIEADPKVFIQDLMLIQRPKSQTVLVSAPEVAQ